MNYDTQLIESIVFFAMEYLDELEIPADFFTFESYTIIRTAHKQFSITKYKSAYEIKHEIDSTYKKLNALSGVLHLDYFSYDEMQKRNKNETNSK